MNKHKIPFYHQRPYCSKTESWCWFYLSVLFIISRFSSSGLQFSVVLNGFPGENLNRLVVSHILEPNWSILIYIIDVVYFSCIYFVVPHCFMGAVVFPIQMFAKLVWVFSKWHFSSNTLIWQNRLIHEDLRTASVSSVCRRERPPEEDGAFNYLLFVSWSLSFLTTNPGVGDTVHATFKGSIFSFF